MLKNEISELFLVWFDLIWFIINKKYAMKVGGMFCFPEIMLDFLVNTKILI